VVWEEASLDRDNICTGKGLYMKTNKEVVHAEVFTMSVAIIGGKTLVQMSRQCGKPANVIKVFSDSWVVVTHN
jgi:hypothetical protein